MSEGRISVARTIAERRIDCPVLNTARAIAEWHESMARIAMLPPGDDPAAARVHLESAATINKMFNIVAASTKE